MTTTANVSQFAVSVTDAFAAAHRLHRGSRAMTFEAFREGMLKAGSPAKDLLQSYQHFKSNPAGWLAEIQPQTCAVEMVELALELSKEP